jgi:hypothetical protein
MPSSSTLSSSSSANKNGNSNEKFWNMVNVASNALFKVAQVENPNDVNEVAVKLLTLFQNIRGEYLRRRGIEETRKQTIRDIQNNPLNVAPIFNRANIPQPLQAQQPTPVAAAPIAAAPTIPPIMLPMKQEDVKNMTQDQAQALLGNLLTQLMHEQKANKR